MVVSRFTVRGDIETFAFFLFRNTQTDKQVDHLEGDDRDNGRPHDDRTNSPQLADHLGGHVVVANLVGHVVIDAGTAK